MPWYKAGTVSVTQNSNAVIGVGTAFIANSRVGDAFKGPDGRWYEVVNIASDTALAISPPYAGPTAAGAGYSITPVQGYVKASADRLSKISTEIASVETSVQAAAASATAADQSAVAAGQSSADAGAASQSALDAAEQAGAAKLAAETAEGNAAASAGAAEDSADRAEQVVGAFDQNAQAKTDAFNQNAAAAQAAIDLSVDAAGDSASAAADSAAQAAQSEQNVAHKVNVSDIVDGLTSTAVDKPLSANQGRILKGLVDSAGSASATLVTYEYVATAGQTSFSGPDRNGLTMAGVVPGSALVTVNGADISQTTECSLTATTLTLNGGPALPAGAVVQIHAFGTFAVANTFTQAQVNALLTPKLSRSDIVGTVSQASGVPTGAIIESGSNANGSYVKYADGTMICTRRMELGSRAITTAYGSTYITPSVGSSAYPASFLAGTTPVNAILVESNGGVTYAASGLNSVPSWPAVYVCSPTSVTLTLNLNMTAIGRWY
ncbi:hypothetical protein [Pseudomonas sp. NFR16]|uniref:hypothetical protein n=1 Tax=Pseudomonas sp. NFR16 TaxID=1566248 RepID=UPI0008C149A0|nr:hypothetical protein [Pseudomonas sp. NFR16]SEJ49203.1 hypothetical protein SAMN03159495_3423 [Pseudomonas sp. NFR16]